MTDWLTAEALRALGRATHGVSDEGLHAAGLALLLLAADVVEGEEQVVPLRQLGRELDLHLLVEVRRPVGRRGPVNDGYRSRCTLITPNAHEKMAQVIFNAKRVREFPDDAT